MKKVKLSINHLKKAIYQLQSLKGYLWPYQVLVSIQLQKLSQNLQANRKSNFMGSEPTVINYANSQVYTGSVSQNLPNGKGNVILEKGAVFQGEFQKGSPKKGKISSKEYVYQGQFLKNQITGEGILIDKNNTLYQGKFQNGKFIYGSITKRNKQNQILCSFKGQVNALTSEIEKGSLQININNKDAQQLQGIFLKNKLSNGKLQLSNGDIYQGNFLMSKFQGTGLYKSKQITVKGMYQNNLPIQANEILFSNGDIYRGPLKDGQIHGKGKYIYQNGTIYEGDFYFGSFWGVCRISYSKGEILEKYEGEFSQGSYNGIGTLYFTNGVIYKGNFTNGAKNGYGVLIYGSSKFKCLYLMNKLTGDLKTLE